MWLSDEDYDDEVITPSTNGHSADDVGTSKKNDEDLYPEIMIIEEKKNPA